MTEKDIRIGLKFKARFNKKWKSYKVLDIDVHKVERGHIYVCVCPGTYFDIKGFVKWANEHKAKIIV